jgi:hypothetical protein
MPKPGGVPMNTFRCGFCALILLSCSISHSEANSAPDPGTILQQMYNASGGQAWDRVAGAELTGDFDLGGLKGTFRQVIDFKDGRDVLTYDVGVTRGGQANTRDGGWWLDEKGLPTIQDAPEAKADGATQSYEDRNGWFHADPAVPMSFVGTKLENNRTFELVRVQPPGGRELTLWIDSATHLLDRAVDRNAEQREAITYFSDYRQVEGIRFPFQQRQSTGDAANDVTMTVTHVHLMSQVNDSEFAPPPSTIRDAHLLQNATSITVPFTLYDAGILVDVSIDGKPPLPFVLDSGGVNLLTVEAAKKLGVQPQGNIAGNGVGANAFTAHFAQIKRYQIGSAELLDQQFLIIPLPPIFSYRGNQEPVAGLIGYEVLRRFQVTIDYQHRQLTLATASPQPKGERLQLFFNTRTPFAKASVDGVEGYFGIDTGDDGALTIFKSFYEAHKFPVEVPGVRSVEAGAGGENSTLLTRVASLSLGDFTLSHPLTELNFVETGAFASKLTAGNIGSQVFHNFVMTLDYEHRALYLQKSPDFGHEMPYNRSGMQLDLNDARAVVIKAVNAGSPADVSGLKPGDQLVAINHNDVRDKDLSEVEEQFTQAAGTHFDLAILRNGERKEISITLQELLPADAALQAASIP